MKTIHETEAVVVGGGAVGCSVAYQLAKRGKDVTLVDKKEPGAGTSTKNFGLVWVSIKEPYYYMELNLKSSLMWPEMVDELGEDVELRQERGGLKLCMTQAEYDKYSAVLERQRRSPLFEGRMISPEEVWELQPGASKEVVGAVWSPYDGDCDPIKWTRALERGCERAGVTIMSDTEVTDFDLDDESHEVKGVLTNRGRIGTAYAVNAAGPWAPQAAEMVGINIELFPERGQILVTEPTEIICPTPMSTVRQDRHGRFLLGTTMEDVGFDWSTTPEAADQIRADAARLVPATADLAIERHYSGLRPMPRDGVPFLGPIPHIPGYYIAVGHSGITLSPIHGKIISDLIVDGETDIDLTPYDPLRYDAKGTTEPGPERIGH
ncbi:MAG: FAD-binding oxidoreductase [Chloroflexota bacterium]|nr:FAD-binding oxidoreductase [Chloroflexota bacterium]